MCIFCTFLKEDIPEKHPFFWAYRKLGGGHPPQIDFDTFQKVIILPKKCVVGGSPTPWIDFDFILGAITKEEKVAQIACWEGWRRGGQQYPKEKVFFSGVSSLIFDKNKSDFRQNQSISCFFHIWPFTDYHIYLHLYFCVNMFKKSYNSGRKSSL